MKPIQELDIRGLEVLDGGMATRLEAKGCDLTGPLWSAHVIERSPKTIAAVHREYLEAGADCLMTASYQISFEGFAELGRSSDETAEALRAAVAIAEHVRREYESLAGAAHRKIWIAASLGPYGAWLHNGSEYHGIYNCRFEELIQFHSRRLAVLAGTGADFVAFETVPSLQEAEAIAIALREHPGIPAAVSFACRDNLHVAHGEKLSDCGRALDGHEQVIAIGVNCTHPDFVSSLIGELIQSTDKPLLVYPNSGEQWDRTRRRWAGTAAAEKFGERALAWRAAGAQWIGGCCRTGPEHIQAIARALRPEED